MTWGLRCVYTESLRVAIVERKRLLQEFFISTEVVAAFNALNIIADPDSISLSGQFIQASVLDSDVDRITRELAKLKIRVDVITEQMLF